MFAIRIFRLLTIAAAIWLSCVAIAGSRGARPLSRERAAGTLETFDPKQSAGLFVGVRHFPHDSTLADVRYAVDDAVDLAFVLAMDGRVRLIDPARIILALSGKPQKPESQQNLDRLVAAGARVRSAEQHDILTALGEQAAAAGRNGMLVIAFASHGVSYDGTQHLLTATSMLQHRETTLSENKIRDITSRSRAARSLILIDACRERLSEDRRNSGPDRRSRAALIQALTSAHGQVVLSAAAAGQYAYDDDTRRNGVFTAAVIDGLRCQASTDERGLVTADTLSAFVEERVLTWIRLHRDMDIVRATQLTSEGAAKNMPLSTCRRIASIVQPAGCTISVASSPIGAAVNADGKDIGVTPLSIGIAEGQRSKIVLAKQGYETTTAQVDCESDPVFITLRVPSGTRQILLSDRFDDNRNNWYTSTDPEAPAGVEDGVYLLGSRPFEFRFTSVAARIDQDADFQITAAVRRLRGAPENHFGLMWGLSDGNNFYFFTINGRGNIRIGLLENARGTPLNDETAVNPNVRRDTGENRLKVARVGKLLKFFVNDMLVHEMEFRPFFGPGVGLGAFNGPIVAAFDELTVEGRPR